MPPLSFRVKPPSGRQPSIWGVLRGPEIDVEEARKRSYIPAFALAAALGYNSGSANKDSPEGFYVLISQQRDVEAYNTQEGYYLTPRSFRLLLEAPVMLTGWTNMDSKEAPQGWGVDHGDIGLVFTAHGVIAYDYEQIKNSPPKRPAHTDNWDLRKAYWQFYSSSTGATVAAKPIRAIVEAGTETRVEHVSRNDNSEIVIRIPPYQPPATSIWNHPWVVQMVGGIILLVLGLAIGFLLRF